MTEQIDAAQAPETQPGAFVVVDGRLYKVLPYDPAGKSLNLEDALEPDKRPSFGIKYVAEHGDLAKRAPAAETDRLPESTECLIAAAREARLS